MIYRFISFLDYTITVQICFLKNNMVNFNKIFLKKF